MHYERHQSKSYLLTAFSSDAVKYWPSFWRIGTIMMRKKGNANENCEDLMAHSSANAITWVKVNRCIFHVGTRRTNGSEGWYLTGIKKRRNL